MHLYQRTAVTALKYKELAAYTFCLLKYHFNEQIFLNDIFTATVNTKNIVSKIYFKLHLKSDNLRSAVELLNYLNIFW